MTVVNAPANSSGEAIDADALAGACEHDVFISYAGEDREHARTVAAKLDARGLSCYLYTPDRPATGSAFRLLAARLAGVARRFQVRRSGEATNSNTRGAPAQSTSNAPGSEKDYSVPLARELERSACVLVLWSQSHRGSFWSGWEVSHFESAYPDKPIFVGPLDGTHLSWPSAQWHALDAVDRLTRDRIAKANSDPDGWAAPDRMALELREAVLDPHGWTVAVGRLRSGTTLPELIRLRAVSADRRPQQASLVLQTNARLLTTALVASAMLCVVAILLVFHWRDNIDFARHHALILAMIWALIPIVGMQAPVAALAPAAVLGTALGLGMEVGLGHYYDYPHAEPAAAAALGADLGVLGAYDWAFRARPGGHAPVFRFSAKLVAVGVGVSVGLTLLIMLCAALALAPQNGALTGPRIVPIAAALMLLPGIAIWQEISRGGRPREILERGMTPALACLGAAITIGVIVWVSAFELSHHGNVHSGLIAGSVAAVCVGAAYVAPGVVLGVGVPAEIRTITSIVCVSLCLLALFPVLKATRPEDELLKHLSAAYLAYFPALVLVFPLARAWVDRKRPGRRR
jgi:hypothetical protein